jgi:hypothetical protein
MSRIRIFRRKKLIDQKNKIATPDYIRRWRFCFVEMNCAAIVSFYSLPRNVLLNPSIVSLPVTMRSKSELLT